MPRGGTNPSGFFKTPDPEELASMGKGDLGKMSRIRGIIAVCCSYILRNKSEKSSTHCYSVNRELMTWNAKKMR